MVSHSGTAKKEKGKATRGGREINTTGGVLGRRCSFKKRKGKYRVGGEESYTKTQQRAAGC